MAKKKILDFLMPAEHTFGILALIIVVHIFLSLGLAAGNAAYSVMISVLYSVFNFPLYLTGFFSFSGYNIYTITSRAILPLAAHIVYWYIISSAISNAIEERKEPVKYKKMLMIVSIFLAFYILFSAVISVYIGKLLP